MPVSGPTEQRRSLGRRLRALREGAGKTLEDVVSAGLGSRTKIWRIEGGQVPVRIADLWALCRLYGVADVEVAQLQELAAQAMSPGPWADFRDTAPDWFRLYLGLEAKATAIFAFDDSVVPGELQTPDYSWALWRGTRPDLSDEQIAPHVELRQLRQQALLNREPPPQLHIVIGENVLHRAVGGAQVLAEQLARLRELAGLPRMDIRYLPFSAGAHPAVTGPFRILDLAGAEDPDTVYIEAETGAHYLEKDHDLVAYRRVSRLLSEIAVPVAQFVR